MSILYLDIRNHDEIKKAKLKNDSVLYIPANMIQFNLDLIQQEMEKVDQILIICESGNRSQKIKDKYFRKENKVSVAPKHIKDLLGEENKEDLLVLSKSWSMNLTRKIQIISGCLILLLFIISFFRRWVLWLYLVLGCFMIYVGLSGNCFLSSFLTSGDL
jgi:hypothetical protein